MTCDFEDGHVCGWELEDGAPDHWRLGNGPVGSGPYALPNAAVGLGFIYVESNTLPTTGTPTEIDTRFQPPTESQFTFHYRTFGFGVASLALFLDTPDGTRYQLWHSPSDRREWQQAEVKICSLQSFKVQKVPSLTVFMFTKIFSQIFLANNHLHISNVVGIRGTIFGCEFCGGVRQHGASQ